MTKLILRRLELLPGRAYLLTAVVIFAAANAVTRKLTDIGANNLVDGRNPISLCNVLFVGNLVALIALTAVYWRELRPQCWAGLSPKNWLTLGAIAILSGALAPALFFAALETTSVNNVVLVGRIEPPLTLALSALVLGERVNRWVVAGAITAFFGVTLTIFLPGASSHTPSVVGPAIGQGEWMALTGAGAAAIATVISKNSLSQMPLGFFNIIRTAVGTTVFFLAVVLLFEPTHFQDAFSPFLWQWMVGYGLIIVVGGQLAWFQGLKTSQAAEVSLASSFNPIAGILAAFLILAEVPTTAQYIGGAVILLGIALNQWGVMARADQVKTPSPQEIESSMGFRGI